MTHEKLFSPFLFHEKILNRILYEDRLQVVVLKVRRKIGWFHSTAERYTSPMRRTIKTSAFDPTTHRQNHLLRCRSRSSWLPSGWHHIVFHDENSILLLKQMTIIFMSEEVKANGLTQPLFYKGI
ncbi:hypothetical protein TNCV_583231 [Trichonephila clavipes]|nr:hypothetical protein TNCV_583231 [Trichonephila clavipes]